MAHAKIEDIEVPGFPGKLTIGTLTETINLPNGINRKMRVSPNYFTFESSDVNVASVTNDGNITVHKTGEAVISLKEAEGEIKGTLLRFRSNTHERRIGSVVSVQ